MKTTALFLSLGLTLILSACTGKTPLAPTPPPPQNSAEVQGKPTVLMISLDGFRHDYVDRYQPPHLKAFLKDGAAAKSLVPVFPSMTFPNHYSLITGLTAERHGLLGNQFYDPVKKREYAMGNGKAVDDGSWYGGIPLWVAVQKQGMVAASYFWVASSAEIAGQRPNYWFPYKDDTPYRERIDQVVTWLKWPEATRPHFVTLYFSSVDSAGHKFGPESDEVRKAVLSLDEDLGYLFAELDKLSVKVDVIIVSDHGMQTIDRKNKAIPLDDLVSKEDFRAIGGGTQMFLYANAPDKIDPTFRKLKKAQKHYKVYLRKDIPERYHFRNHPSAPDILIDAQSPWSLGWKERLASAPAVGGSHGYDPADKNMHGIFYARGPHIKTGVKLPTTRNVNVYPFVLELLQLDLPAPVDGKADDLRPALKKAI